MAVSAQLLIQRFEPGLIELQFTDRPGALDRPGSGQPGRVTRVFSHYSFSGAPLRRRMLVAFRNHPARLFSIPSSLARKSTSLLIPPIHRVSGLVPISSSTRLWSCSDRNG